MFYSFGWLYVSTGDPDEAAAVDRCGRSMMIKWSSAGGHTHHLSFLSSSADRKVILWDRGHIEPALATRGKQHMYIQYVCALCFCFKSVCYECVLFCCSWKLGSLSVNGWDKCKPFLCTYYLIDCQCVLSHIGMRCFAVVCLPVYVLPIQQPLSNTEPSLHTDSVVSIWSILWPSSLWSALYTSVLACLNLSLWNRCSIH